MVAFDQPRVADRLASPTFGAGEERTARYGLEVRACRVGDVLAAVTSHADSDNAFDVPLLIAHRVDVENVEKTCVWHGRVPRSQLHVAGWDEVIL